MTIGALVLALALTSVPYRLVLSDGHTVHLQAEPEQRGGVVVGTLADGTVVSVPARRVDWDRTRVANLPVAEARLEPAVYPERAARRLRSTTVDNSAIERFNRTTPASQGAPRTGRPGSVVVTEHAVEARPARLHELVDDRGRDADFWRDRARGVLSEIRSAERDVAAAERELIREEELLVYGRTTPVNRSLSVTRFPATEEERGAIARRISELREALSIAEGRLDDAHDLLADLHSEARRSGAQPGWLRPDAAR